MILPKHVTILVDTREQKPLPLPKTIRWFQVRHPCSAHLIDIRQEPRTLYAGDYVLKEAPKRCIIERKGNINELWGNLCGVDRHRAMRAFRKLCDATANPILALDFPLTQRLYKGERDVLFTRLAQLCAEYRLQVISAGGGINARHALSDLIVRILLSYYFAGESGAERNSSSCPTPLLNANDP